MLIETANNNIYFAQHLPRLTDIDGKGDALNDAVVEMLECFVFSTINQNKVNPSIFKSKNGLTLQN
jgi:hypothetical protein